MLKRLRCQKGFTMIEMMVVLIIIAVLVAGGIRFYLGYIENSRVTKAKANIATMQAAMDSYYAEYNKYCTDITLIKQQTGIDPAQTDPWGKTYSFPVHLATTYTIQTGYGTVQGTAATFVNGIGTDGKSDPPVVGATP